MTRSEAISYCMTYALIADLNLSTSIQVYNRLQTCSQSTKRIILWQWNFHHTVLQKFANAARPKVLVRDSVDIHEWALTTLMKVNLHFTVIYLQLFTEIVLYSRI